MNAPEVLTPAWRQLLQPDRCSNLECPNKPDEGRFVLLESHEPIVSSGARRLRLWLCAPCAGALTTLTSRGPR